jgi:hypothetical protein
MVNPFLCTFWELAEALASEPGRSFHRHASFLILTTLRMCVLRIDGFWLIGNEPAAVVLGRQY